MFLSMSEILGPCGSSPRKIWTVIQGFETHCNAFLWNQ